MTAVFLVALGVRVIVASVVAITGTMEDIAPDTRDYLEMAEQRASGETAGWTAGDRSLDSAFATFLRPVELLFRLFGAHAFIAQLMVAVAGAAAAVAAFVLARRVLSDGRAVLVGLTLAVVPSLVLWSSLALRDGLVWALAISAAVLVAETVNAPPRRLIALACAVALVGFLMGHLRAHSMVVLAWALVPAVLIGGGPRLPARVGIAACLALAIPWLSGWGFAGSEFIAERGGWDLSLSEMRGRNAAGASSAFVEPILDPLPGEPGNPTTPSTFPAAAPDQGSDTRPTAAAVPSTSPTTPDGEARPETETDDSLTSELSHLPRGLSVMLLEPFPWASDGGLALTLAKLETLAWYPALMLALVGLWAARRCREVLAYPVLVGAGMLLVYALAEGNLGTAFRHRAEFAWVVVLLAGLGTTYLWPKRPCERLHPGPAAESPDTPSGMLVGETSEA